jgi:hypothetical protein
METRTYSCHVEALNLGRVGCHAPKGVTERG